MVWSNRWQLLRTTLLTISVVAGLGCAGSSGPQRLPVSGQISGPGSDTLTGSISFTPAKGHVGPGATCSVDKGVYRFDKTNGPTAGPHDVTIRRAVSVKMGTPGTTPAQSRKEWKLTADVPGQGSLRLDFKLDP